MGTIDGGVTFSDICTNGLEKGIFTPVSKHHIMEVYSGHGSKSSCLLVLIIRWMLMLSYIIWLHYPCEMSPWYLLDMEHSGSWNQCEHVDEEKNPWS
jgi:hypothetical protein